MKWSAAFADKEIERTGVSKCEDQGRCILIRNKGKPNNRSERLRAKTIETYGLEVS